MRRCSAGDAPLAIPGVPSLGRRLGVWLVLVVLALPAIFAEPATAGMPFTRADYDACHAQDEAGFRAAVEAITQRALTAGLAKLNYRDLVLDAWRAGGVEDIIDKRVDAAVTEVRQETSWSELLKSLAVSEKAQALATAVAERVYRSDPVKAAFEGVAGGVGKEIGRTIELSTLDAADPALKCIQAFIGPRYGASIAGVITTDAEKHFAVDPATGAANVTNATIILESGGAIAGSVLVAVRRQLSNMASRIGQRLVGSVLSRIVSSVATGVGVVLIAKDIWDFRYGVLPIVEGEMKSRATKDKVIDELAKGLSEQMVEHTKDIAAATADRVMGIWQEFRASHAKVLELAERHESFRKLLDTARPEQLPRIDEVVAIVVAEEGENGFVRRLADGTLQRAISGLPPAGLAIARESRSIGMALAWAALAGNRLDRLVDYEIHRHSKPADFTGASLGRVLALDDKVSALRVASLPAEARATLFELDDKDLRTLARALSGDELQTLARYLTGLNRNASQRVLRAVAELPSRMQMLASARVRDAVLSSGDQNAAVGVMLRADNLFQNPWVLQDDVQLVLDGRIHPLLLWEKHPVTVSLFVLPALFVFLMFRRLFAFGRRRPARA